MEIKPIRKIKRVRQSHVTTDDLLRWPRIKSEPAVAGEPRMEFVGRQLFFNGREVGEIIRDQGRTNPQALAPLANALEAFKERAAKKSKKKRLFGWGRERAGYTDKDMAAIAALCDAYIARIGEEIKRQYDQTKEGLNVFFDENGQLILNGINIHALIAQCGASPNPKSLAYLKGVRARLAHVLENKVASRNYDRIRDVVLQLFGDIDAILKK